MNSSENEDGFMASATVKATVRRFLVQSHFVDKAQIFNFLLLVIGNGFEWQRGQLIEKVYRGKKISDEPRWADESGDTTDKDENPRFAEEMRRFRILRARRQNNHTRFVIDNFEALYDEPIISLGTPYPPSEYSRLFTMPDDVKPDWKEACNETSQLLNQWLYSEKQRDAYMDRKDAARRNGEFRQKHFADQDAEMRRIFNDVLREPAAISGP